MADPIVPNVVVSMPSQLFTQARAFKGNANGKVYIGLTDTDPTIPENQIQVYLQNEDGTTVPMAQPIMINSGGYPVYNGQIAKFVTVEDHSMAVYDAQNVQQFYFSSILKYAPDQLRAELSTSQGPELVGVDLPAVGVSNLQDTINGMQWQFGKSVLKSGGRNDKTTDNTALVQSLIDGIPSGYVIVEYGCKWNFDAITQKDEVQIIDQSGYNYKNGQWGAQLNYFFRTADPATKNAHEFILNAYHHPGLVVNNLGGGIAQRASLVLRYQNVTTWRIGSGISDTDNNFVIAGGAGLAGRHYMDAESDAMSWNTGLVTGVSYNYGNRTWTDNIIVRYSARTDKGTRMQFYTGTLTPVQSHMISYNPDGTIAYTQNGVNTLIIGAQGELYSNRFSYLDRPTSATIIDQNAGRMMTNFGAVNAVTYTLPAAQRGKYFEFAVAAAFNMTIRPSGTDVIRNASAARIDSAVLGSIIKIVCVADGYWDIASRQGTWTL